MTTDPFMRKTIIREARVVATLSRGGGAIVETGDVDFREGRLATIMGMGEDRVRGLRSNTPAGSGSSARLRLTPARR